MTPLSVQLPTFLYRLYDAAGDLLYIGITDNVRQRMDSHAANKPWWPEVARLEVTTYPSRQEADEAERRAIRDEKPRMNINGAPPRPRRRRRPSQLRFDDPWELARSLGLAAVTSGQVMRFLASDGTVVCALPKTPSDSRQVQNALARIRRRAGGTWPPEKR